MLAIISSTNQKCSLGCLTCNEEGLCIFCDPTKNFKLEENTCTKILLENCEYIDFDGNCLKCDNSKILDIVTKKCVTITEKIENCFIYSSNSSCETCEKNFFISSGKCEEIKENLIKNCEFYSTATECKECEGGYILSLDRKSCEANPSETNCAFYSRGFCENCKEGYLLNYQLFAEDIFKFETDFQKNKLNKFYNNIYFGTNSLKFVKVCKKTNIDNCEVFLDGDKCTKCKKGFYLDETYNCLQIPLPGLENCFIYDTEFTCKECASDHYLENQSSCISVIPIDNCLQYDGTASTSRCSECIAGYYSDDSSCAERIDSKVISNCKEIDLFEDKCEICEDNFVLSSDGHRCFNSINNCENHENTTSSETEVKCLKCKSGYFLFDTLTCNMGDIVNCDIFGSRADICNKCKNTYYLSNNACILHPDIPNCEDYSNTENLTCLKCDSNFYNFKITETCKYETPINNCVLYFDRSPIRCKECELNFYLLNNQCLSIQTKNCTKYDGNKCTECEQNHALDLTDSSSPKCSLLFTYVLSNCSKTSVETDSNKEQLDQAKCLECNDFSYPIDHKQHYVCVRNDKLEQIGIPTAKQVSGCLKYNIQKECVQCEKTHFLENKKCVTQCSSKVYRINRYKKIGTGGDFKIIFDGYKECLPENTSNWEIFAFDVSSYDEDNLDIVIKCKDNTLPIHYIYDNGKHTNIDYNEDPENYILNPIVKYPVVGVCVKPDNDSPVISNCDYYKYAIIDSKDMVRCLKCKQGYNAVISEGTNGNDTSYFIDSCVRDNNLKVDFYHGIDSLWIKLFSAHKCSIANKIPFLAITHANSNNPQVSSIWSFNLDSLNKLDTPNGSLKTVDCYEDRAANFGYDVNDTTEMSKYQKLPEDCALGVINLTITNGDATKNRTVAEDNATSFPGLAQYCASCKAGYKDTIIHEDFPHIKVKCDKIENCSGTKWFNMCSKCSPNYVYEWKDNAVDFKSCILNSVQNCYSSSSKNECSACKKGYNLNKDLKCETMSPVNCKSNFNFKVEHSPKNFPFASYKNILGVGCNECQTGYKAVELNDSTVNPYVCTSSLYLEQNSNSLPSTTNYIKNCQNYGIFEDRIICQKCISNYVLNPNQDECFNGPTGCDEADSASRCLKCKLGHMIENSICLIENIAFCKEFNLDNDVSKARCKVCEENYFLTDSYNCDLGEVMNCKVYQIFNSKKCLRCMDNFAHYSNGVLDYCFKIDSSLNCKQAAIKNNNIYGAELQCKECNNPHELLTSLAIDIDPKTKCMEFSNIENCKIYDSGENLSASSFVCLECENNFYLKTPIKCTTREYFDSKCLMYELDQDKCEDCDVESVKNNKGECKDKPIGIRGCREYTDLNTCVACDINMYLENNVCKSVANENLIIGCLLYNSQNGCEKCEENYYLDNFNCITASAKNCLTYTSVDICATCKKGFGLKVVNETTDCVKVNIESCLEFTPKDDFPCTKCNKNYYVDEGKCVLVQIKILNCEFYENIDTCSKCENKFALDVEGKNCILLNSITNEYDENCSVYTNKLNCSVCRPGAFFDGASCAQCGDNKGCFYCDPNDSDKCLICQTDFYMNSSNRCLPDNPIPKPDNQEEFEIVKNSLIMIILFLVIY